MAKETFVRFVSIENVGGEFQVLFSLADSSPLLFFSSCSLFSEFPISF